MAYENLRAFIPSGHCVPPSSDAETPGNAYEAFQKTDHGFANELLLRVAQKACLSCIQRPWCEEQRDPIASELWRVGVKHPMIAAERVDADESSRPMAELDSTKLQFDLSELPKDPPERFLSFLRQGVRANQLSIVSRTSSNLAIIAREYRELLGARHPETLDKLNTALTEDERGRAYRYISLVLCQQASFRSADSRGRYRPELHDFETYYPTVRLYMEEAVAVKNKGYHNPGQMAMHYDPEYCDNLLRRFGQDIAPRSHFFHLVINYINDPVTALTAFLARVQSHRAAGGGTITNIQRRAGTKKQTSNSPSVSRKRAELQAAHATASPAAIEDALANSDDPALRIQTIEGRLKRLLDIYGEDHRIVTPHVMKQFAKAYADYEKEAEDYIGRFEALERAYAGDSDFSPYVLGWIASKYKNSLKEADNYKQRLKLYRGWSNASDNKMTDTHLRECAKSDFDSYEDIIKSRMIVRLRARFSYRSQQHETAPAIPTWMLNRIAAFYPPEEMDEAAEGLYQSLGKGILTTGVAELRVLQDPFAVFDANEVADPRTKEYLTFSARLQNLTPQERLMIARRYNLIPLLYGRQFSCERVDLFLGTKEPSGDIVELPSIAVEASEKKANAPLPAAVINQDILNVLQIIPAPEAGEKYSQEAYDLVTIVGAGLIQIPQVELNEQRLQGAISAGQKQWLQRSINGSYPPADRRQKVKEIESALCAGRVVVRGDAAATYQLALADSFYTTSLSDLERAVIAQVSGVDRLLYDQDVSLMLKYRLDTTDLVDYLTTDILPRIGSWKSIGTAAAELQFEENDLELIVREEIQRSQVWYARGRIIAISSDAVASLREPREVYDRLRKLGVPCSPGVIAIVMRDCSIRQDFVQEVAGGYRIAGPATIQRLANQIRSYPLATADLETPQDLARRLGVEVSVVVRASKEVNITNMRTVSGLYRSVDEHGSPRPLAMYYKPLLIRLIERRIGPR